jgi:ribosomal protein S6--L-glutamate ligase
MKIAILTHNMSTYSQQSLAQIAKARGHEIHFIHLSYCYTNIGASPTKVYYRDNETLQNLDAIIPRIQSKHSFYGTAILRQFERIGVFSLNSSISINWSLDKLRTLQLLARKSIPLPNTGFADSPEETEKLIDLVGGAPLIVRLISGAEGKGTIFAETYQAAISVINAFKQLKTHILVQEYIKESAGHDIRCIVVGNHVIGAMQRSTKEGGFRSSYRFLTHNHPVKVTAAEQKLVIKAARAMKLNFATVDIIRSPRGPLILDLDPSPNIEALEKSSKMDIMNPILQFLEENVSKND